MIGSSVSLYNEMEGDMQGCRRRDGGLTLQLAQPHEPQSPAQLQDLQSLPSQDFRCLKAAHISETCVEVLPGSHFDGGWKSGGARAGLVDFVRRG